MYEDPNPADPLVDMQAALDLKDAQIEALRGEIDDLRYGVAILEDIVRGIEDEVHPMFRGPGYTPEEVKLLDKAWKQVNREPRAHT